NAHPVLIPIGAEDHLRGQYDIINRKAIVYLDDEKMGSNYNVEELDEAGKAIVEPARESLIAALCDIDDELGTAYLEEKPITPEMIKQAIRRVTIANKFIPVVGGSAFKN